MICNKDLIQMHQLAKQGGGEVAERTYATWTIQTCPVCMKKVIEYYAAVEITDEEHKKLSSVALSIDYEK